jgi:hypothetical protein
MHSAVLPGLSLTPLQLNKEIAELENLVEAKVCTSAFGLVE